ncbi:MAG: DUF4830 domain-containing protein [Acutalibacter sp.]|nr:DUF4830 domain-containing protein [Acutalibacter sp.]
MFVSMKASRKRIIAFLVLAAAVVAAVAYLRWGKGTEPQAQTFTGETNEERVAFLQSFGWQTEAGPAETREVMIPAQFNDVYQNYNAMQQAQGFDLAPYAGEVVTQYKYKVTNYPGETEVFATLLVYGRLIIGGDLACAEANGFMHGFAADSARYGEATPRPEAASSALESGTEGLASSNVESAAAEATPVPESRVESAVTEESAASGENVESTGAEAGWPTD